MTIPLVPAAERTSFSVSTRGRLIGSGARGVVSSATPIVRRTVDPDAARVEQRLRSGAPVREREEGFDGGAVHGPRVGLGIERRVNEDGGVLGAPPRAGILQRSDDGPDLVPVEARGALFRPRQAPDVMSGASKGVRDAKSDVAGGSGDEDSS